MIKLVFLGVTSAPSKSIPMSSSEPQPISFNSRKFGIIEYID